MSYTFNMVSGVGQGKGPIESGTIVVAYPAGSVCNVTNGSDTYTALDNSGAAAFIVEPGTWTVTATGTKTASKTVTVTAGGWVEVELIFTLNIIKNGDVETTISGGLVAIGVDNQLYDGASTPQIVYDPNSVSIIHGEGSYTGYPHGVVYTSNAIDLTPYSQLSQTLNSQPLGHGTKFGVLQAEPTSISCSYVAFGSGVVGTAVIDISSINGFYYLAVSENSGTAQAKGTVVVTEFILS